MTRKVTTTKTAEERRQQATALQASITEKVDTLRNSDQWRAFLDMTRGFHRYSLNNLLLIWSQYPEASRVAGFQQWRARGRQVRKGEKAIRIFGYATKKITDDADAPDNLTETDESGQRRRVYFPVLSVFDISQTDPIDAGAVDGADLTQTLTGADDLGVLAAATDYLTADGWSVEREPLRAGLGGFTDFKTRRVVIAADVEPAEAAATALHEAAHVLLHGDLAPGEYQQHRGTYETEAESLRRDRPAWPGHQRLHHRLRRRMGRRRHRPHPLHRRQRAARRTHHRRRHHHPARRRRSGRLTRPQGGARPRFPGRAPGERGAGVRAHRAPHTATGPRPRPPAANVGRACGAQHRSGAERDAQLVAIAAHRADIRPRHPT